MNYKMMGRFIGNILLVEAAFMLPAALISLGYGEYNAMWSFLAAVGIALAIAMVLRLLCKGAPSAFYAKEGLVCVAASWIVLSLVGCLPFYISREIPKYVDAFFEIVSGFTTTGASIVPDVEALSHGIIYWRSFSHWLGGMGVLVFLLAFTGPKGQGFTMHLLRAESPGPDVGKLVPKIRQTAGILYIIYVVLTVINILFLVAGKMPLFEAVCTGLGTAGTGGFGIKNDSMGSYSPYIQNVTTVFMAIFGVNFSCYYLLLLRKFTNVFKDEELRLYVGIILVAIALLVWDLWGYYGTFEETLRHSAFQVSSIITTTGYSTTDFDLWPSFSKTILLLLMLIGGSAGSTAGGLKVARFLLLSKSLRRNIRKTLNPKKVMVVRNNGSVVDQQILDNANAYLAAYVIILFALFAFISLDGHSIETNLSAVFCTFNNVGPGLAQVGPLCNFSIYSDLSTFVLSIGMLAGRLEIFPILALLSCSTWKR